MNSNTSNDTITADLKKQSLDLLRKIEQRADELNLPPPSEIAKRLSEASNFCEAYAVIRPLLSLSVPSLMLVGMWRRGGESVASGLDVFMAFSDDLCNIKKEETKSMATMHDLQPEKE